VHDEQRIGAKQGRVDWLTARRAFYAEFAPLKEHANRIDQLYVMKDCGVMTADRRSFASPLFEIAFLFSRAPDGSEGFSRVVAVAPSFGHRNKRRPFHGWAFGLKCKLPPRHPFAADLPSFAACQRRLQRALSSPATVTAAIKTLDRLCGDLASVIAQAEAAHCQGERSVAELAARHRRSTRTVHRRISAATGLPPKRFLAVERFRRAVLDVPSQGVKLSEIADALGFADQAHMNREFKRHAGLSPGEFRRTWCGARGQTVRFVQDDASASRLRLAVLAMEGQDGENFSN
jgi:AraC-like DNA-binding protein